MLESLDYIPTPWGNAAKYEGGGGENVTLDSPNFIGIPTAPTAAPGTNTTQIATTEFVTYAITLTGAALNDHISLTSVHGATASNTASRIVLRDGSGNFAAGTITANLTGIASEAIKLQTARTINGIPFDGTADITIAIPSPLLLGETGTTAYRGDRGKAAYDHINLTSVHGATASNTASRIVLRDGSGSFSAGTITVNRALIADTFIDTGVYCTTQEGFLITTDIPVANVMTFLEFTMHAYMSGHPAMGVVQCYPYVPHREILAPKYTAIGNAPPSCRIFYSNSKLCFWFPAIGNYTTMHPVLHTNGGGYKILSTTAGGLPSSRNWEVTANVLLP